MIVNLDRNAVELAQGWYVDTPDSAGALAEVLRLLAGTEHLPDNPFSNAVLDAGGIIMPSGEVYQAQAPDRVTTGN